MTTDEIKSRIHGMLRERAGVAPQPGTPVKPSQYWSDFCEWSSYVMDLSEDSLRRLRLHTYHLTGDNYQSYYFRSDAERWRRNMGYDELIAGLPPEHTISEPTDGIGLHFERDGRFLSGDVVRFQRIVRTLSRRGILQRVASLPGRPYVLEIGGGYGGLALHLQRMLGRAVYVILDLPETLFFSAVYLAQHAAGRRVYLYDASDFDAALASGFADYDFVLVPNWKLQALERFRFELVINVESMQEMTTKDVTTYLDFIRRACDGVFYSWNMDRNHKNDELTGLNALLRERFDAELLPAPPMSTRGRVEKALRGVARSVGFLDTSAANVDLRYYEHICRPKRVGAASGNGAGA